ncbi:unnamed protein product [Linum trigynum]|uniref:DDE Tnp4 domain-containing protein n=1 Tax=Linum trigynum TaxID=586398 RepID=A0AAV2FA28_9ROSI
MNFLSVCNPNLEFLYCVARWEGSAHDGKVLRDALARPNGLRVLKGNYYLVDAGYSNCEGFLAPFRGQKYHLKEWGGGNMPLTLEEYFNMKHAIARNVIERIFGILKMRWAILRETSWFSPEVVTQLVNACCLMHNFIKLEQGVDTFEWDYRDKEPEQHPSTIVEKIELISGVHPSQDWTQFRSFLLLQFLCTVLVCKNLPDVKCLDLLLSLH